MCPLGVRSKLRSRRDEDEQIALEILAYLARHNDAQDSLEGIVQWWLLERDIEHGVLKVRAALDELATRGLVLQREGKDSRMRYGINRRKRGEIDRLLQERSVRR